MYPHSVSSFLCGQAVLMPPSLPHGQLYATLVTPRSSRPPADWVRLARPKTSNTTPGAASVEANWTLGITRSLLEEITQMQHRSEEVHSHSPPTVKYFENTSPPSPFPANHQLPLPSSLSSRCLPGAPTLSFPPMLRPAQRQLIRHGYVISLAHQFYLLTRQTE
jgi:hypothetical protein